MKKIMFNEHYGLETATLNGSKIRTARIVKSSDVFDRLDKLYWSKEDIKNWEDDFTRRFEETDENIKKRIFDYLIKNTKYKICEIVAIAQCYEKILSDSTVKPNYHILMSDDLLCKTAGWGNKMFVKAEYMPHQIQITDIKLERLQEISDEDCLKEGLSSVYTNMGYGNEMSEFRYGFYAQDENGRDKSYFDRNPKEAFSILIDKICGIGTWDKNPWAIVYYYKLIK
jgi:hypothetical protein